MRKVEACKSQWGELLITDQTIYGSKFLFDCRLEWSERNKITKILFRNCLFIEFPSPEMLIKFIPNLKCLEISYSKLFKVTSYDLFGYNQLTELDLCSNEIEELPGDLFLHTPNLERISFAYNKIKVIDEKILDPLINLKSFNLRGNSGINAWYFHRENLDSNAVLLNKFKEAIKRCTSVQEVWKVVDVQKKEIDELRKICADQNEKFEGLKKVCETLEVKVEETNIICRSQNERIQMLEKKLDEVKQAESLSKLNFTVKIAEKEFKVQKEILIANSPLLAQIIHENEGADTLELKKISEESFKEILNFMTDKNPPKPTANLMELYAASGRLQMKNLLEMCAKMLIDKVTPENAFEILGLCKKFENIELQKKAYAEYGKSLEN